MLKYLSNSDPVTFFRKVLLQQSLQLEIVFVGYLSLESARRKG
jgi:hypothetical protein